MLARKEWLSSVVVLRLDTVELDIRIEGIANVGG